MRGSKENEVPCVESWPLEYGLAFHVGNILIGLAFALPKQYAFSLISFRGISALAFVLDLVWIYDFSCSADFVYITIICILINTIYFIHLFAKHFPVYIKPQIREFYRKVFEPLGITKKDFKALMKDFTIEVIRAGKTFASENETKIGPRLRILLHGKLAVKCDETFLHFVQANEFVDAIEWRGRYSEVPHDKFQVTIDVVNDSTILVLKSEQLERTFAEHPKLKFLMSCILGKDITRKLYMLNENVYNMSKHPKKPSLMPLDFHRTNSTDAIHTGGKGLVRSQFWIDSSELKDASDGEQLAVVNFALDIPPPLTYLPHSVPVHTVDKAAVAEAHFLQQQRRFWPHGML